jgi:hypothetical protein
VWQRLQAFCLATACSPVKEVLISETILLVFSKENRSPSALPTGRVSAKDGPQLFGPWMSFQVRIDRCRKFDAITLLSNCFTWSGWHAALPQVFSAIAGS